MNKYKQQKPTVLWPMTHQYKNLRT